MNLGMCYGPEEKICFLVAGWGSEYLCVFSFSEMAAGWSCCSLRCVASLVPEPTPHFTDNHWCLGDVCKHAQGDFNHPLHSPFFFWTMHETCHFVRVSGRMLSIYSYKQPGKHSQCCSWLLRISKKSSTDFEKKSWEGQNTESYGYLLNLRVAVGKLWAKCVSKAI